MRELIKAASAQIKLAPQDTFSALGGLTIEGVISGLVRLLLVIVVLVFFFILVLGGVRWITSRGDKAEVEGARNQITHALIGLAIIFVAWAIIQLVGTMFGVELLNLTIPTFT
ncbi:MAG: hypothetical protein ABH867_00100 [Patescibacteria group bacterium]|nr:hypothetical protein [Patescibacteria group bacterium]